MRKRASHREVDTEKTVEPMPAIPALAETGAKGRERLLSDWHKTWKKRRYHPEDV
jgi:hypothetical protein